ncbi:MAG TPA: hypothetical protein VGS13_11865, partial [Stellaceae bacterium]|nr:hypothetical protein [Stellaceae bacterium]
NWGSVASGGRQIVEWSGVAHGATVKHGGDQIVYSGGVTRGTLLAGGSEIVYGTAYGGRVNLRGLETVYGTASGGTIDRGIIEVASGGTASGTVTFVIGGTLQLDGGASFTGVISGFAVPDRIDLRGISYTSGVTTASFTQATSGSGVLTVTSGTQSVQLTLLGTYVTSNFTLSTDNHGGTRVTDPLVTGAAARVTFADIAPAGLHSGAPGPSSARSYLPSALAANDQAYAGRTLLATGPPGAPDGDPHILVPGSR